MTPYQQQKRRILCEFLDRFPDASSRMLARMAYNDYPEFFKSMEDARGMIRSYRGVHGKLLRQRYRFNKYFKDV